MSITANPISPYHFSPHVLRLMGAQWYRITRYDRELKTWVSHEVNRTGVYWYTGYTFSDPTLDPVWEGLRLTGEAQGVDKYGHEFMVFDLNYLSVKKYDSA